MRPPDVVFPERLALAMKAKGWNLKTTAEVCGVGSSAVWKWSKGDRLPGSYSLAYLCYALGVSADWILGLSDTGGIEH